MRSYEDISNFFHIGRILCPSGDGSDDDDEDEDIIIIIDFDWTERTVCRFSSSSYMEL